MYLTWAIVTAIVSMTTTCFFVMLFECKHVPYVKIGYEKQKSAT